MGCFPSHDAVNPDEHDDTPGTNMNNVNNNNNNNNTIPTTTVTATTNIENIHPSTVTAVTTATATAAPAAAPDPVRPPDPQPQPSPSTNTMTNETNTVVTATEGVVSTAVTTVDTKKIPVVSQAPHVPSTDHDDLLALPSTNHHHHQQHSQHHRPNSAPSTNTNQKKFQLVNKLSPSVAHSSLAAKSEPIMSKISKTTTMVMGDHKEDDDDDNNNINSKDSTAKKSDNTVDTNSNFILQKITEGGEEAIHHLRNIFATPISFAVHAMSRGLTQQPKYIMPHYPKTEYERNFLQTVLQNHYLFDSQSKSSLQKLINAFEVCTIDMNDPNAIRVHDDTTNTTQYHVNVIQQGEEVITEPTSTHPVSNAYFYVVYYGTCQFLVDDVIVGYANIGDAFGELALLYNGPRAATVTAILQEDAMVDTNMVVDADGTRTSHRSNVISSTMSDIASTSETDLDPMDHTNEKSSTAVTTAAPPSLPDYTVVLFRVHQRSFRVILQQDDQDTNDVTMNLLNNIEFLQNVPQSVKENLAQVMVPFPFNKGDHILQKGIMDCPWYVIERGTVLATNLEHGYQDFFFTEGQCFGERAIMADAPAIGDVYAETAGVGFTVDHTTFKTLIGNVLGTNTFVISRHVDAAKLKAIGILSSATQTDHRVLNYLSKQITDQTFPVGAVICRVGEPLLHLPSLYLVRKGIIRLDYADKEPTYIVMDAYFGEDQLEADMTHTDRTRKYISPYTATVIEECTCGILKLRDCRNVIDTRRMGEDGNIIPFDSLSLAREVEKAISMNDLSVHQMIGAGTFGQVFIVSRQVSDGSDRAYALKVQSKYELCQSGQAKGVVREKNLMKLFHHPFVAKLLASFQDEKCVYMVMNLLQGGELYSVMHTKTSNILPEKSAKFYIACVAEALFYLHCSHSLVFRDLKPENVMIDDKGYAILIDFGFCKKISGKTYTTCGTPLYLAPEVILNRGHSWSVDYWSLGIMIYEMLVGHTPFYEHGMNKAELFQNIIRGKVYPPEGVSPEVLSLLSGLLRRDPAKRLGSLIGNESDIIEHPWFRDIDRDSLFLKELDAPFIPQIKDPFDSSNFSSWKHVDDKRFVRYPTLSPDDEVIFNDF